MATLLRKNFDTPDEVMPIPNGNVDTVKLGELTVVRSTFEPGWKWSESVGPMAHADSCQVHHIGYLAGGHLAVRLNDGSEVEYGQGDVYDIPPGHDAWVLGSEPVVMVNEAWVAKFLPQGTDPLRERLAGLFFRRVEGKVEMQTAPIVGVVADVRYSSLDRNPEPVVYFVDSQRPALRRSYVVTSADGHPERLIPEIRATLRQLDPRVPP